MTHCEALEQLLLKSGATSFFYAVAVAENKKTIMFELKGRRVRFTIKLPDKGPFTTTPTGKSRTASVIEDEYAKACNARIADTYNTIKAQLEYVNQGEDIDDIFFANIVLPDTNKTVKDKAKQLIAEAYSIPSVTTSLSLKKAEGNKNEEKTNESDNEEGDVLF